MPRAKKLPAVVYSLLGPVPVAVVPGLSDSVGAAGLCNYADRTISLCGDFNETGRWQTLGHELMHIILYDGGLDSAFTDTQHEQICDVFGSWFAGAVMSGALKLNPLKPETDE